MAQEIFISYSSKHRELTRELAAAIEAQYGPSSVWWDHALEARGPYATQIRAALDAARVVVVLWTAGAQVSEYVYAEAMVAHAARKLVNVRPATTPFAQIPEPFNIHHVEDLCATERILRAVAGVMTGHPVATVVPLHELYFRQHGHRLIDAKQEALPADVLDISPSQLLQARYEQVDYLDATGQRAALIDWALNRSRRAAGRLLHGPGGIGKTRLLIEVAAQLRREHGWMAGFVEHAPANADDAHRSQRRQALRQLVELGDEPGLLLVLDYAEGRQDELLELAQWIEVSPELARRPVRLVLLARSAGEWWSRLADEQASLRMLLRAQPGRPAVLELAVFGSPAQRRALFETSCATYRRVLTMQGLAGPAADPPAALRRRIEGGEKRSRPLSIQMEALVWLACSAPAYETAGVAELLDQVLGLERRHWARVCGMLDEAALTELERGLAQLTLVQGAADAAAAEALMALDSYYQGSREAPADMASVLRRLGRLYGDGAGGLRPLEPDLLGERLVARAADLRLLEACVTWVDAQAELGTDDTSLRRGQLTTVLQRVTAPEHGPHGSKRVAPLLDRLVQSHLTRWAPAVVATIVETPGHLLQRLQAGIARLDVPALAALDEALPLQTLALDQVAMDVAWCRLEQERAAPRSDTLVGVDGWAGLAARWGTWGLRLSAAGRREDALAATEEAVQVYRGLAQARPDAFLPNLATSLNNLGNMLSDLGRREDALAATEEAVKICRGLAQARPDAFLPDLALSLSNLGKPLSDLGRREDALAATEEAVQVYRGLAQARPDAFLPDLAMSRNNLGNVLSKLGRREDALAAIEEAVQVYRGLAQARPDAFLPNLAASLNNLGSMLSKLGRREDALAATEEAVQVHRGLARARPDAFLADLATSLSNLGNMLSELGRREDALAATEEAVTIRRGLAHARPDAFLPNLATSLNNLGNRLSDLGLREDALAATEEAVTIRRGLAQALPDAFLPNLATSLHNLGNRLSDLGRREDALAAIEEAVQVYRGLAQARPDAFVPDLAGSLGMRSMVLAAMGQHTEAALGAGEGLAVLLPLLGRFPETIRQLATSLARHHLQYAKTAAHEPNITLMQEVAQVLGLGKIESGDGAAPS
ncbi:toll/interleukin-1 receptor domain-containing protein [Variovorax sp. dw_308]|uniref:toll/interleukin-1 receptor domain-containing protein n=1 Tax=Variovorax sp. dw_308 TaxID=2721546 RepID=UPI001C481F39|nr:toll/interleukin-1 receptor domain-containing protein [Variovorax sp. dw_308]